MVRLLLYSCTYGVLLFIGIIAAANFLFSPDVFGVKPGETAGGAIDREIRFAVIAAIATALGIASRFVFDAINAGTSVREAIDLRRLAGAMLLAPVVLGAAIDPLQKVESVVLSLVFCYQNGFFFQSILGNVGARAQ